MFPCKLKLKRVSCLKSGTRNDLQVSNFQPHQGKGVTATAVSPVRLGVKWSPLLAYGKYRGYELYFL